MCPAPDASAPHTKLQPLEKITSADGIVFFFDPAKVTAVRIQNIAINEGKNGEFQLRSGPLTTHVYGIVSGPVPVDQTSEQYLQQYNLTSKFVTLSATPALKFHVRATAVTAITSPPSRGYDKEVKSLLFPAQNMGLLSASEALQAMETPEQVKALIDQVRSQQDAPQ
jgi:hypothetical protein